MPQGEGDARSQRRCARHRAWVRALMLFSPVWLRAVSGGAVLRLGCRLRRLTGGSRIPALGEAELCLSLAVLRPEQGPCRPS